MSIIQNMKDESIIPKNTDYCYTFLGVKKNNKGINIKLCPYWSDEGCSFLNLKNKDSVLLWDQVKECGVELPDYDED